jgi:hypothetical protein
VVWVVALAGGLRALARRLWPEMVVLVGLVGCHLAGPTVAVLVRCWQACSVGWRSRGMAVRGLLVRHKPAAPGSSSLRG